MTFEKIKDDELMRIRKALHWQLIDTAPRDGTAICVGAKDGKWWFRQARWDEMQDAFVCDTGDYNLEPTHWVPLPPEKSI